MSEVKGGELKCYEIDKSKLRHRTDDTIATAALNHGEDSLLGVKMEVTDESAGKPTELCLQTASHLVSSTTSSLADTPGDSGVLCLDSENSEVTGHALMCHSLMGTEELACDSQCDQVPSSSNDMIKSSTSSVMTKSDIDNQNLSDDTVPELIVGSHSKSPIHENLPDVVLKALESEMVSSKDSERSPQRSSEPKKSLSEDIVFRRKCRKKSQNSGSQKKRVSFHEDILNSTKTDNIHIERGFISYGPDSSYCDRFRQRNNIQTDRYSWCSSGDKTQHRPTEMGQQTMSDILTYGDSQADKSGIFEYHQNDLENEEELNKDTDNNNTEKPIRAMYGCESNSSDSNFSCDSETSSSDSTISNSNSADAVTVTNKKEKTQKSYSCDGFGNNNPISIMRKTYFSEADIDQSHVTSSLLDDPSSPIPVKSVLKKKRYIPTNVVEERKSKKNIIDTNNIIGSLKSFYKNFNFKLTPEKGVPESSLDLNNVVEAIPSDINQNKKICKSLDSGFHVADDDFVEINLNDQPLDNEKPKDLSVSQTNSILGDRTPKEGSPRHMLTLNMKEKKPCELPPIEKYVVNCESTVYEHKGVSYSYVHDTFQTAFDAPKQSFVPLPESTPIQEPSPSTSTAETKLPVLQLPEMESRTSTPKRQYKNVQEDIKSGIPKHLASPKKQNFSRFRKSASSVKVNTDTSSQLMSDDCSNTDNSTIKGVEDFEDFFDSPNNQKLQSNKSVLLSRYLKNVYQKKDLEMKIKKNKFFQNKLLMERAFPSIIYPMKQVSPTFRESAERMSRLIDKEVIENKRLSVRMLTADEPSYFDSFEDNVAIECSEKLRLKIFSYPNETLNRMMRVQSPYKMEDGSWSPQLVFITDYALYVASVQPEATEYEIICKLPHNELDAIAVGPEHQYIQFINTSGRVACSVVTAESSLGARLASSLEWSARTSPLRSARPPACLMLKPDVTAVSLARKRGEKKVPPLLYYGRACWGLPSERVAASPGAFAPPLEGFLMCRPERAKRFEPCYFLLRAGVLQWGSCPSESPLPHSLPLRSVVGVRRLRDGGDGSRRPHCFEIAPAAAAGPRLLLAAPDEPAASSWLQSILLHAAQAVEEKGEECGRHASRPSGCTLLVTSRGVAALRDSVAPALVLAAAPYLRDMRADDVLAEYISSVNTDVEILAYGALRNLTAFKIPDTDDNWCCLEWCVCEAAESGGGGGGGGGPALLFSSGAELERFIAAVEAAYSAHTTEPFPLSVVDASQSPVSATYATFEAAWRHMLPATQ